MKMDLRGIFIVIVESYQTYTIILMENSQFLCTEKKCCLILSIFINSNIFSMV